MNIPIVPLPIPTNTYLYQLVLLNGKIIQTQSRDSFEVGQCVTLWHAGGVALATDTANFVEGHLERSNACKSVYIKPAG